MANVVPQQAYVIDDSSISSPSTDNVEVLLVGMKLAAGSLAVNTPTKIFSTAEAIEAAGEGSQLVQQVRYLRSQSSRVNTTIVAMDAPAGAAATFTITFGGVATTAQALQFQVEDQTITVPVVIADDGTAQATAAAAELADPKYAGLHVTAGSALAVLTLTVRSLGEHGNEINVKKIFEPPGTTQAVAAGVAGTGAPDVAAALASLGAIRYNYICIPDTNATNLTAVQTFLEARFAALVALDGAAIAGKRDTVGNLATLGLGEDTEQILILGDPSMPANPWAQAAVYAAARATKTNIKVPLRNVDLNLVPPDPSGYLDADDRNTVLAAGIAVYFYVGDVPRIDRSVTLYKLNKLGQASTAYFDLETKLTVSEIRQEHMRVLRPELGKVLLDSIASTEVNVLTAGDVTDADRIRDILTTQYVDEFMPRAWTSDFDSYKTTLVVTKTGPNSVTFFEKPKINGILYDLSGTIAFTQG